MELSFFGSGSASAGHDAVAVRKRQGVEQNTLRVDGEKNRQAVCACSTSASHNCRAEPAAACARVENRKHTIQRTSQHTQAQR